MMDWFRGRYVRCELSDYVVDCLDLLAREALLICKKDEVRSHLWWIHFAKLTLTSFPRSSEIADACACDINYFFHNVASASIRGINPLSLSHTESRGKVRRISSMA